MNDGDDKLHVYEVTEEAYIKTLEATGRYTNPPGWYHMAEDGPVGPYANQAEVFKGYQTTKGLKLAQDLMRRTLQGSPPMETIMLVAGACVSLDGYLQEAAKDRIKENGEIGSRIFRIQKNVRSAIGLLEEGRTEEVLEMLQVILQQTIGEVDHE